LSVGDIVVASSLMQHDMDASPLFPRYSVPLLGRERFLSCPTLTQALRLAARRFAEDNLPTLRSQQQWTLVQHTPKVQLGLIASGDQFIASDTARATLRAAVPDALAVEMEGAAVAQVCYEYTIPFAVMRVISDAAGTAANHSFATFLTEAASAYSYGVMRVLLHRYNS
jgi:adenosylhomocysteine nucleosidase